MPTFAKVVNTWKDMNIDYGYTLKISNWVELLQYWQEVKQSDIEIGLWDLLESGEFASMITGKAKNRHVKTTMGQVLLQLAQIEPLKEKPAGLFHMVAEHAGKVFQSMMKVLERSGALYVQERGGYFCAGEHMVESDVIEKDNYVYPDTKADIRIIQWGGGTHYYAKVGRRDVVDAEGNQKWDTEEEARRYAEKFKAGLDI